MYATGESSCATLHLTPVLDGSSIVTFATIDPRETQWPDWYGHPYPSEVGMRRISAYITLYLPLREAVVFGGFTISRL
jgi:hypothetical protein